MKELTLMTPEWFDNFFTNQNERRSLTDQLMNPIKDYRASNEVYVSGKGSKDDPIVTIKTEYVPEKTTFHSWKEDDGSFHRVPVEGEDDNEE